MIDPSLRRDKAEIRESVGLALRGRIRLARKAPPRESVGLLVKQFFPFYRHVLTVKWQFLIGIASGLLYAVASGAGLPLMTKVVFPVLFQEGGQQTDQPYAIWLQSWLGTLSRDHFLFITCLWIPFVFAVRGLAGYTNGYMIQFAGQRVLEEVRADMFIKLQGLPLSFFKKSRSGDLLSRLMGDTMVLRQVLVDASSDLIKQPATLISAFSVLVYLAIKDHSFFIALISLMTVPICVFVIRAAGKRLASRARELQAHTGAQSADLAESLQSSLEIRAYNLEERQVSQFRERTRAILRLTLKVAKYSLAISPSIEVVAATGFAVALFAGVRAGMTLEGFMTLGFALYMSYEPIKKLGVIHALFRKGGASLERMEYVLNQPDVLSDPVLPTPFLKPQKTICFENLTFAYEDESVLRDVNVEIPIGQVVALVGPSGAGKSTFANMIPRFYDPQQGRIRIDGTDIRDFTKKSLREQIAVVPQMPSLFAASIGENIRLGRLDASDEDVKQAARRAHADDFISAMPEGYDTQVGERGDQLSGGQRQRIAIARAFLRDAPILILDEATSALDAESEEMVQAALSELVKGRTTFIIAHRFSTITIADRVLVFQKGLIVADGSHQQLAATSPIYQKMMSGSVLAEI